MIVGLRLDRISEGQVMFGGSVDGIGEIQGRVVIGTDEVLRVAATHTEAGGGNTLEKKKKNQNLLRDSCSIVLLV